MRSDECLQISNLYKLLNYLGPHWLYNVLLLKIFNMYIEIKEYYLSRTLYKYSQVNPDF